MNNRIYLFTLCRILDRQGKLEGPEMSKIQTFMASFYLGEQDEIERKKTEQELQARIFAVNPQRWKELFSEEAQTKREAEEVREFMVPESDEDLRRLRRMAQKAAQTLEIED